MPNHKSPTLRAEPQDEASNFQSPVPTYLPLPDAARKYRISEKVLTHLIQDGRIEAAQLPSGELLVADNDLAQAKTKEQIIAERFAHLRGKPITISEAALCRWSYLPLLFVVTPANCHDGRQGKRFLADLFFIHHLKDMRVQGYFAVTQFVFRVYIATLIIAFVAARCQRPELATSRLKVLAFANS